MFGFALLPLLLLVLLVVGLMVSLHALLRTVSGNSRFPDRRYSLTAKRTSHSRFQRMLRVPKSDHPIVKEKQETLLACGLRWGAGRYMAMKRLCVLSASVTGVFVVLSGQLTPNVLTRSERFGLLAVVALLITAALTEPWLLDKLKQLRRLRAMRDIYAICRQLLYYSGHSVNLHGKLLRCMPFIRTLRSEWQQLMGEWYHNAEYALRRFQERVSTSESTSFAETLNALRQYDDERYYALLRERIADYKEKMELYKESRKESVSYLLFVMSGIPIIYTFRVFIYPWVAEGQQLFHSLN